MPCSSICEADLRAGSSQDDAMYDRFSGSVAHGGGSRPVPPALQDDPLYLYLASSADSLTSTLPFLL